MSRRAVILVVDANDLTGAELCSDLQDLLAGLADVKLVHGADEAVRAADSIHAAGGFVPLALVDLDFDAHRGADVVVALHAHPHVQNARTVLVTSRALLRDVDKAL